MYILPAAGGPPVDVTPEITISPSWLTWTGKHTLLVSSVAGGSQRLSAFTLHGNDPATQQPLLTVAAALRDGTLRIGRFPLRPARRARLRTQHVRQSAGDLFRLAQDRRRGRSRSA